MKNIKKLTLLVFCFHCLSLLAHDEFYKWNGSALVETNNLSEAIKWDTYSNLPFNVAFEAGLIPGELVLAWIQSDFTDALNEYKDVDNTTFTWTYNGTDRILINFHNSGTTLFENQPAGVEYTAAVTVPCLENDKFVVSSNNPQNGIYEAGILYNNLPGRMFTWGRTCNISGFACFIHVSLHELGHILGLNHCTAGGDPVMQDVLYITSISSRCFLQWADEQGFQAISAQNPSLIHKMNPMSRFFNKKLSFFEYEPEVLYYIQEKPESRITRKEIPFKKQLPRSGKKSLIIPRNFKKEGVIK